MFLPGPHVGARCWGAGRGRPWQLHLGRGHHGCVARGPLGHQSPPPGVPPAAQGLWPKGGRGTQRVKTAVLLLRGWVVRGISHKGSSGVGLAPHEKITQIQGIPCAAGPRVRLVLQQGSTGAAAHRGGAGGPAVAELELEATHAYTLIMSLGSLPMRPGNCKVIEARGRAQLGLIWTPLMLQLPLQPQLRCCGRHIFSSLRGQGRPIND